MKIINGTGKTLYGRIIIMARANGYDGELPDLSKKTSHWRRAAWDAVNWMNSSGKWSGKLDIIAGGLDMRTEEPL